jgi:hypothetical protein
LIDVTGELDRNDVLDFDPDPLTRTLYLDVVVRDGEVEAFSPC